MLELGSRGIVLYMYLKKKTGADQLCGYRTVCRQVTQTKRTSKRI